MVIGVLVEISNKNVDKVFDYLVPPELEKFVKVGMRVLVPFGSRTLEGFVLEIKKESSDRELREVLEIVDQEIVLNEELLLLGKKMQKKTLSSLISCYQVMLPKALKAKKGGKVSIRYDTFYHLSPSCLLSSFSFTQPQEKIIQLLQEKGTVLKKELVSISSSSLQTLIKRGILVEEKKEHYRLSHEAETEEKKVLTEEQRKVV